MTVNAINYDAPMVYTSAGQGRGDHAVERAVTWQANVAVLFNDHRVPLSGLGRALGRGHFTFNSAGTGPGVITDGISQRPP
ncbi:MAG: hypothetical protein IPJ98_23465 [Bryobacterales bacterium]|nr:hypothetical protein [Bryobacterales bacterium]